MDKKGFTLVELLVVIALIGLLIAIAVPAGLKVSTKIKQKMLDTKIETIEQGAIVWGQNNKKELKGTCTIEGNTYPCITKDIETMLNTDKSLEEDKEVSGIKQLINPTTNENINNCQVRIYIKNKRVYAKYDKSGDGCYNIPKEASKPTYLVKRQAENSTENYYEYANSIIEINFVKHINIPDTVDENKKWNVADTNKVANESDVVAWLEEYTLDSTKYILYIGSKKEIHAPEDSSNLFKDFSNLKKISFINFNTKNVTNMSGMFRDCAWLIELDLNNFKTGSVTNMSYMFAGYAMYTYDYQRSNPIRLDLSSFDTGNVINMSHMFSDAILHNGADLSSFDTGNVTDMSYMFAGGGFEYNFSNFNTEKVKDMSYMFYGNGVVTEIDLSYFNTKNVTNMSGMFSWTSFVELDLSDLNTENVEYMDHMFTGSNTSKINLSNLKTGKVKNMSYMFYYCDVIELDLSNFKINDETNTERIFGENYNLTTIYLNDIDSQNKLKPLLPENFEFSKK